MKLQLFIVTLNTVLGQASGQSAPRPIWVPQAPPFGAIAALAGIPDLASVLPVAGPLITDVRVAEWNPLGVTPLRFLRLTERGRDVHATVYIWWFGHLGQYEPPDSPGKRCTAAVEGSMVCILPVSVDLAEGQRRVLLRKALQAVPCERPRGTDAYELRIQAYERRNLYRTSDVCDPFASEVRALFDRIAPNESLRR